jgi:DNA-binding SARP family transcriptional activator/Tfp pilus assembly protein PilF
MWLGLLGPLVVRGDGAALPVLPGKQRVMLAALALLPGQAVSLDELIRALWDDNPPPRAAVTVRNYVLRLRQALGPAAARMITRAPGYLLEAGSQDVDVYVFEGLCEAGGEALRTGDWQRGADLLGEALSSWRGSALADVPSEVLHREKVPQLEQMRLLAAERRVEARLNLGQHSDLVPELQALVAQLPLRETFHCQFMTALYRAGQRGEALAAYRRARNLLVAELGVEPGDELQQLHQRILAADPELLPVNQPRIDRHAAARQGEGWSTRPLLLQEQRPPAAGQGESRSRRDPVVPRQLPAVAPHFTGREPELAELDLVLATAAGDSAAVVISAVGGMAGVGKTALAVRWAHRVADRFPDGQLYVNLQGFGPAGELAEPAAAIRGFLDGLGVAAKRVPVSAQAQAGLYRSLLAGRRMLLVLDNARDEDQVRPLLPGSASCVVVVTSRTRLTGLAASEGARLVSLGVLSDDDAQKMLARRLGGGRVAAEPEAVAELTGLCGRLPLAVAIAAARAADRPGFPLAELAAELRDGQRLPALDAGDAATSVQAVFRWSYQQLDAPTARLFRLLSLYPGRDITEGAAAQLAALPWGQTRNLMRGLARSCLLTEYRPGRYRFHDLLLAYAAGQAKAADSLADRHAARTRLFDYYLAAAEDAAKALDQSFGPSAADRGAPSVTDGDAALAWLDAERANLTAIAADAAGSGWPGCTIRLAAALFRYLDDGGHFTDARTVHTAALDAARRAGDRAAQADVLRHCVVDFRQGRYDQASGELRQALGIYRDLGDRFGQGRTLGNLGHVLRRQGSFAEAGKHLRQALVLARDLRDAFGEALALDGIGTSLRLQGHYQSATHHHRQAIALYREIGESRSEGFALENLAVVLVRQERWQEAAGCLDQALAALRQARCRYSEADITNTFGAILSGQGRPQQAADHHRQALTLYRELGDRSGEANALNSLGEALTGLGLPDQAASHHQEALTVTAEVNDRYEQARAHAGLARASSAASETTHARRHWQHAFTLYTDLGCPEASQVRSALQDLDNLRAT